MPRNSVVVFYLSLNCPGEFWSYLRTVAGESLRLTRHCTLFIPNTLVFILVYTFLLVLSFSKHLYRNPSSVFKKVVIIFDHPCFIFVYPYRFRISSVFYKTLTLNYFEICWRFTKQYKLVVKVAHSYYDWGVVLYR